jgi:hypothetical protein
MSTEIRNIYPGEAVFLNDTQLLRVQTFGAQATLNSEDVNELGNLEVVEVVDNVPSVAITLNVNDHGSLTIPALLAGKNPKTTRYVRAADFENASVDIYAPIIKGEDYGKTNADVVQGDLDIFRTVYINNAFVNSMNMNYNTGAIATEEYALESDNKAWFSSVGASIVSAKAMIGKDSTNANLKDFSFKLDAVATPGDEFNTDDKGYFILSSGRALDTVDGNTQPVELNSGDYALEENDNQQRVVKILEADGFTLFRELTFGGAVASSSVTAAPVGKYLIVKNATAYQESPTKGRAEFIRISETDSNDCQGKILSIRYAAKKGGAYFTPNHDEVSGMRLGQIQVYMSKTIAGTSKVNIATDAIFWRLQSSNISVTLSREQLQELGHFRPYARPLTFPIPVTVSCESTDADLRMFAQLCGKDVSNYASLSEVSIDDLVKDQNLIIKLFRYTDVDRKKIASLLKSAHGPNAILGFNEADTSYDEEDSGLIAYGGAETDYAVTVEGKTFYSHDLAPMKVVVAKKLIPTGENQSLAVGSNGTQTFDFRTDNVTVGIGGGNTLCLGTDKVNAGSVADPEEIPAGTHGWQAFKFGGVISTDVTDI